MNKTWQEKADKARNLAVPELNGYNGKTYWRSLRSDDILRLFGVGGKNGNGPIPKDFTASMMIGDTQVHIVPAVPGHELSSLRTGRGDRPKRRVFAECNVCGRFVCAGHLDQHMAVHKKEG